MKRYAWTTIKTRHTLEPDDEITATCFSCGGDFLPGVEFWEYHVRDDDHDSSFFHMECEP